MSISKVELEEIRHRLLKEGYNIIRLTPKEAHNFRTYKNHKAPWKTTEIKMLVSMFELGADVFDLSKEFGRTPTAILGQLLKLKLVEWKAGSYFKISNGKFYFTKDRDGVK